VEGCLGGASQAFQQTRLHHRSHQGKHERELALMMHLRPPLHPLMTTAPLDRCQLYRGVRVAG